MNIRVNSSHFLYKINNNQEDSNNKQGEKDNKNTLSIDKKVGLVSKFNDHLISFGARVDKGLERFYDVNKERMPIPVRRYIEGLDDKSRLTPMEAQRRAFYKLENANTIDEIKEAYSDDKLFDNLINPSDSKAKRGVLASIKENEELLALSNQSALKSNENFTVYLVKKVFLEAKTVDEINQDLENDLNPDFKADFKFKNPDSPYIYGSTLKALGIKTPEFEYQQSLRYTRDGYSDEMAEKISKGLALFWESLDDSERTSRAKQSAQKFENWWDSLSKNQKLDMIADQLTELEMLKAYKKYQKALDKENNQDTQNKNPENISDTKENAEKVKKHTKVGSNKLSQDELFVKWSTNQLKIYEAGLSEADKDTLHIKRMQRLTARWANMSAAERTDYISKMKAGSEPLRYTMIDAWNHSMDLIKDLSAHLKANQIYKPADLLYSTQEFSEFQSRVMTEFWENHQDYAKMLGDNIIKSQEKVQMAISRGTFEELKKQIMRDKNQRVKEMEKFKSDSVQEKNNTSVLTQQEDYKKDFREAYNSHVFGKVKSIPKNYYNDMYDTVLSLLPKDAIVAWTKNLNGEFLTKEETEIVKKYIENELPQIARFNRALEAAMADTLYEFTKNPDVYTMSNSDVKMAMYHLERGEEPIVLDSHKVGKRYVLNIKKQGKVNPQRINTLYENYKQDLSDDELEDIRSYYFYLDKKQMIKDLSILNGDIVDEFNELNSKLLDYIKSYGKSALVLFSEKSTYPVEVKNAFNQKFLANMPKEISNEWMITPALENLEDIKNEQKLAQAKYLLSKRFNFVYADVMNSYFKELALQFRKKETGVSIEDYINLCCQKRPSVNSHAKVAVIQKKNIKTETKLKLLAFEQAMADVLFESTGNEAVYSLGFENLCDNLELFSMAKKYPTQERTYSPAGDSSTVTLCAKKRPNLSKLQRLYKEYMDELIEWVNTDVKESGKADPEELLYILSPEDGNYTKDINVARRMAQYDFNVEKFSIKPNN